MNNLLMPPFNGNSLLNPYTPTIDVRLDLKGRWLKRKAPSWEWKKSDPEFLEWEFNNPANKERLFPHGIVLDKHTYELVAESIANDAQV